ncbi:MAG TPA: phosphoglycerate mutase family protein [Candidatus Dormibacteraeota bacterium]
MRHAAAGDRDSWESSDESRPLTGAGRRQAQGLLTVLEPHGVRATAAVLSSDYVRCRQTVEPLAAALALAVRDAAALREGSPLAAVLDLVASCGDTVLCSHGDVVSELVLHLDVRGLLLDPPAWPKASTWVLGVTDGAVLSARYVGPPA